MLCVPTVSVVLVPTNGVATLCGPADATTVAPSLNWTVPDSVLDESAAVTSEVNVMVEPWVAEPGLIDRLVVVVICGAPTW